MVINYLSSLWSFATLCTLDPVCAELQTGIFLLHPQHELKPGDTLKLFEPGKPDGIWIEVLIGHEQGFNVSLKVVDYYLPGRN